MFSSFSNLPARNPKIIILALFSLVLSYLSLTLSHFLFHLHLSLSFSPIFSRFTTCRPRGTRRTAAAGPRERSRAVVLARTKHIRPLPPPSTPPAGGSSEQKQKNKTQNRWKERKNRKRKKQKKVKIKAFGHSSCKCKCTSSFLSLLPFLLPSLFLSHN